MPTIVAIATPAGSGGIGIVRMSGPGAKSLLARVFLPHSPAFKNFRPWTMHHGILLDQEDKPLDDVLAVFMPGPKTYSGEDMAEIQCHGGHALARAALESLLRLGARLADAGEFTRRAYLNGRMDLSQAEAVAEMIAAPSREALAHGMARLGGALARQVEKLSARINDLRALARVGVDFPDDEVEGLDAAQFTAKTREIMAAIGRLASGAARGRLMAHGASVVLAGPVNVGKSSLLNALSGRERALVADIPGTTRDFIEEMLDFDGLPVRLADTAGLRQAGSDPVESLGMARSLDMIAAADLVAVVLDCANPPQTQPGLLAQIPPRKCLLVWNKLDLAAPPAAPWAAGLPACAVSAKNGENIDNLAKTMRELLLLDAGELPRDIAAPPNTRQLRALEAARADLEHLLADLDNGAPWDCCLASLDGAAEALAGIIRIAPDDALLDMIFSQFCIGK